MPSVTSDKIVPFGQKFVLDDMPLTLPLKERVAFFLCLIYVSVDSRKNSESRLGCSLGSHIAGLLDGVEDCTAPCSGNLREEPVLYGVPLGAVRRIVGYSDIDAQSQGRFHGTPFELPAPGIVGASSIAKDADAPVRDKIRTMRAVYYPQCNTPEWPQVCCQRNNMLQVLQ